MAQPYIGEIRMFGGNFAPAGWMLCEGQLLPISENDTLFALIGTTYGGDGQSTFGLPDLRGRLPIHQGTGPGLSTRTLGEQNGVEDVTLTVNQLPIHTHLPAASAAFGTANDPAGNSWAVANGGDFYTSEAPSVPLPADAIDAQGGSQPHTNLQPYLCVNFIISLFGIFPSQS